MWRLSSFAADRPSVASRFGIHLYVRADRSLATTEQDREQRPHVDTGGSQVRRSPLNARTAAGENMFTIPRVPLWTVQSGASGPQTVRRRSATTQHRPTTVNGVSPAQKANRRYRSRSRHAVATLRLTGQLVPHIARSRHLRAPELSVTAPRTRPSTTSHFRHRVHRSRPPQTPGSGPTRSADLSQR